MQIHELTQRQPVKEGLLGAVGSLAKNAMGVKSTGAAGITDPKKKLAAVKAQPELVKMAQGWADEWIKTHPPGPLSERTMRQNRAMRTRSSKPVPGQPTPAVPSQPTPAAPTANTTAPKVVSGGPTGDEYANLEKKIAAAATAQNPAPTGSSGAATAGANAFSQTASQLTSQPAQQQAAAYIKDFLAFANQKIAMRDPNTYRVIGLKAVEDSTSKNNLKQELETAKNKVADAQTKNNAQEIKNAVTDYLLTALAGAQLLITTNNLERNKITAPAYDGKPDTAPTAQPGQATQTTTGGGFDAKALERDLGLTDKLLGAAKAKLANTLGPKQLDTTGNEIADSLLRSFGYSVS